jgi:hypothetical protein
MKGIKKYIIICSLSIFLITPIIFDVFTEFLLPLVVNLVSILVCVLGLFILIVLGALIEILIYNKETLKIIQKHDLINSFIQKTNRLNLWIFFLITMIMEELIFRYYSIGILNSLLHLDIYLTIIISSVAFSLYHIHTWFFYKNLKILIINLVYPFFMGLYLGFLIYSFGFFSCVVAHLVIAFFMHYNVYRIYYNNVN